MLSDGFGPAVVGVLVPEIVLPRWALRMSAEELRLACLHEAEHRDAGDPWLLLGGALAATLVPWNPVLWWQLRRLRAAVEVDCDARVLKRGASRRIYGGLLLELGAARSRSPLPVLALARSRSLLERRLKMIVRNVRERRPLRSLAAAGVSAALLVVACETPPPTTVEGPGDATFVAAEVDGIPAKAEIVAEINPLADMDFSEGLRATGFNLRVDGVERSELPHDLDAGGIERVEVRKPADGAPATVDVFTSRAKPAPLIYVDGVRVEGGLPDLAPETIERVEVLKGDAATALYGAEGADGVIRITMKGGRAVAR